MNEIVVVICAIAIFSSVCIGLVCLFPPKPELEIVPSILPDIPPPPPFYYNVSSNDDTFKKDVVIVVEHPDEKISIGTR